MCDKAFNIDKICKYDGYQMGFNYMGFFDKENSGGTVKNKNMTSQRSLNLAKSELAEELRKQILENSKSGKYTHLL